MENPICHNAEKGFLLILIAIAKCIDGDSCDEIEIGLPVLIGDIHALP